MIDKAERADDPDQTILIPGIPNEDVIDFVNNDLFNRIAFFEQAPSICYHNNRYRKSSIINGFFPIEDSLKHNLPANVEFCLSQKLCERAKTDIMRQIEKNMATISNNDRMISVVHTSNAPAAIGPYSNGMVFVSGQIPIDPKTGAVVYGSIEEQTNVVEASESGKLVIDGRVELNKVVKTTVLLKDMNDFAKMNEIYAQPARAAFEVARLPRDVSIEVECVAVL
ncbi:Endoribonuclease L-PSP/chorismate mutase-like domain-containing protein [Rozella allomycis CSF55]|uniref:Endoribonuclease L-PSP/chorismate mutase-like domain-containing protein n=1 Tax=Rozella allomycis (strain CSF55) TaxID=988480 RepID=A0A075APQ4_ROZAC|nr:Endoribonuclease L-PSP/chorismate mutase-like domain-containing protein [Rozella allomycis CSF55]|eukprot:EPZ32169.1 Endoribonuclease L-PSP/chorismate mutase-like domain-containing protein [Rozella allomycis CSF55]